MEGLLERAQTLRTAAHALKDAASSEAAASIASHGSASSNVWHAQQDLVSVVTASLDEAEEVVVQLAQGQAPNRAMCATLIATSMDAIKALLHRINDLEWRVQEQAAALAEQAAALAALQPQLDALSEGNDALLFRELAAQTTAKLVRTASGCSAWDARRTPLSAIKHGAGAEVYRHTLQQYPLLKVALEASCAHGRPVAQPVPVPHVTEQSLRALIQRAVPMLVIPAAEQLLACLLQLSTQLGEPLFITAVPPS